ncbi:hypothetical protein ACFOWA_13260 [Pedobacter lithocola]|uniref:Uncharacterized protein n=1 Tax=Pedobacter lithocola TaxID=1908239 RepID=A0ABV8PDS3_9SPHI
MEILPVGTVLKTKTTYFEITRYNDSGTYDVCEIEGNREMFIDEEIIHLGLEDGTWEIID